MSHEKTAVLLIGYQNDYFAEDGILVSALEDSSWMKEMLGNTVGLLDQLKAVSYTHLTLPTKA